MTITTRTEFPVVQSAGSCCSTVPAPVDETAPADPQASACCSTQG
jgi:hypothetical protein